MTCVNPIIGAFWDLCRLRGGPQFLPASSFFLTFALTAYILTSFIANLFQLTLAQSLFAALFDAFLLGLLSYIVLWVRLLTSRWIQTATAMAGTGAVLMCFMIPLSYWQTQVVGTPFEVLPYLLLISLLVWDLFIVGNILRHALDVPLLLGTAMAGVYLYISIKILYTLFVVTPR